LLNIRERMVDRRMTIATNRTSLSKFQRGLPGGSGPVLKLFDDLRWIDA
jgi:hypothetical protein